jgi:hypothetical protein
VRTRPSRALPAARPVRTRPSRALPAAAAFLALAFALAGTGCGGDDESAETTPELPNLTSPRTETETEAPAQTETEPAAPVDPGTETLPPDGDGDSSDDGGVPAPAPEAEPPADTPENDTRPPPGSPAERFEEFCEENPGACG